MGNTLGELLGKFAAASTDEAVETNEDAIHEQVLEEEQEKTASDGGNEMADGMGSLAQLFLSMTEMDKTAAAIAEEPELEESEGLTEEDIEKIAAAEAGELVDAEEYEEYEEVDMMKVAAEYDAAGRIMARGFFDEYIKLATGDNQNVDAPSYDKNPAHGERALPTLDTNYQGDQVGAHHKPSPMNTKGGDQQNKDVLNAPGGTTAGNIVGPQPDRAAGGRFGNLRDVMKSNM